MHAITFIPNIVLESYVVAQITSLRLTLYIYLGVYSSPRGGGEYFADSEWV